MYNKMTRYKEKELKQQEKQHMIKVFTLFYRLTYKSQLIKLQKQKNSTLQSNEINFISQKPFLRRSSERLTA